MVEIYWKTTKTNKSKHIFNFVNVCTFYNINLVNQTVT